MERLTLFWVIHVILLSLFAAELLFVVSVWLQGRMPGLPITASRRRKAIAGTAYLARLIFSHQLWALLRAFVTEGLLQQCILRISFRRWSAHIAVYGSFVLLGILSAITGLAVEIFPRVFSATHFLNTNIVSVTLRQVDHPLIAFINDFLGLTLTIGLALMAYRRWIEKPTQLAVDGADGVIIVLLLGIALTGFSLEAVRMLAHGAFAPTAEWGFLGYLIAQLVQPLDLNWDFWYNGIFWLHFAIANILLFYTPFSRFTHVLMSPIIVTLNTLEESTTWPR